MNKKLTLIGAFVTALDVNNGYAVGSEPSSGGINGRVVDAQSQILPGASIYVKELKSRVISDNNNGFFTIPKLLPGR